MGLEKRQEGGKFITILGGKLCIRVPEGTPGAIQRTNKIGNVVNELFYESFTGKLVDIKTQDGTYGKSWNFMFKDKEDIYTLQLSYSNSFATNFLKILPNIDLTKEMKVSPSLKEVDGKNKSSLFINQDGHPLKHRFTRDNPGDMPDMEKVTIKGELVWDDTKRLEFLQNMVNTTILPQLVGATTPVAPVTQPVSGLKNADVITQTPLPVVNPVPVDPLPLEDVPF